MQARLPPAPLTAHLGFWLRFVSNHVSQSFAHKLQGKDVSVAEWAVMRDIYDSREELPSILAERLGLTRGAISKIVDRLVEKRFAVRIRADGDGRSLLVRLSPKGRRIVPVLAALADENELEFFDHLTRDERATMQGVLHSIVERCGLTSIPID